MVEVPFFFFFASGQPSVTSPSVSSPITVQIRRSHRIPKRRRQLFPPEDVLRHQPIHIILPQQHHRSCVIGPRCTGQKGQLPEAHDSHGGVYRKSWKSRETYRRREAGQRRGSEVSIDHGAHRLIFSQCS